MKEKLLARIKGQKGFTLIELLVVIAIIAILVVIVLVAIDPIERINDANDRAASADVNQIGSAMAVCITDNLITNDLDTSIEGCNAFADLTAGNYTNLAAAPGTISDPFTETGATPNRTNVCVAGTSNSGAVFSFSYTGGQVVEAAC